MPRLDDPNIKLKKQLFKRESLRPWDDIENFKPVTYDHLLIENDDSKMNSINIENANNKKLSTTIPPTISKPISKPLVNNKASISKPISKPLVNNKTSISKPLVNQKLPISKPKKPHKETISKPISKQISKPLVNPLVNQNSTSIEVFTAVKRLTGNLLKTLMFVVDDCKARGGLHTTPITNETLRTLLNTDADSAKTTVQRLINKGFMKRKSGKRGNGGYTTYGITEEVLGAIIEIQKSLISKPLVNPLVNELVNHWLTDKETEAPSSSSSNFNIIKTTTTSDRLLTNYVEVSGYKKFGFSETHLQQLQNAGIDLATVEQSLIEFNHDFEHKCLPAIKTTPVNFLMGLLRNGQQYVSETYRTEEEKAIADMAKKAEVKRQKLQEEKFLAWESSLDDSERKAIESELTPQLTVLYRTQGISSPEVRRCFFEYYLQQITAKSG